MNIARWLGACSLVFACAQVHAASARCGASGYRLLPLPLRAQAINDSGEVAGTTEGHRAAVWTSRSGLREIPIPDGFLDSEAVAINRSGEVAGNAHDRGSGKRTGFVYRGGVLTLLAGDQTRAYAINDSGVVAGASVAADGKTTVPTLWFKSGANPLRSCCGGTATGVDAAGEAVGDVYDEQGRYHAFFWSPRDGIRQIGPSGPKSTTAIAANARGHTLIQAFSEVYLYTAGELMRLELHPKFPSKPLAINGCDVVVGAFGPFSDADRAFIWDKKRGFRDLNGLLPPDTSGWKLEYATGINEHGVIVGRGDFKGEDGAGYMLTPEN